MQLLHGRWRLRELQFRKHAGRWPLGHWRCEVRQVRGPALRRVRQCWLSGWLAAGWLAGFAPVCRIMREQAPEVFPQCCCCAAVLLCCCAVGRTGASLPGAHPRQPCDASLPLGACPFTLPTSCPPAPMAHRCGPTPGRCKSCFSYWNAAAYYSDIGAIVDNEDWPIYKAADGRCRKVGR